MGLAELGRTWPSWTELGRACCVASEADELTERGAGDTQAARHASYVLAISVSIWLQEALADVDSA